MSDNPDCGSILTTKRTERLEHYVERLVRRQHGPRSEHLEAAGVSAILVGETLMRAPDIGLAVERLLGLAPEED